MYYYYLVVETPNVIVWWYEHTSPTSTDICPCTTYDGVDHEFSQISFSKYSRTWLFNECFFAFFVILEAGQPGWSSSLKSFIHFTVETTSTLWSYLCLFRTCSWSLLRHMSVFFPDYQQKVITHNVGNTQMFHRSHKKKTCRHRNAIVERSPTKVLRVSRLLWFKSNSRHRRPLEDEWWTLSHRH